MNSTLNPYLSFKGNARQAMDFYQSVFDGKVESNTFGEAGMPVGPSEADNIMHSQLTVNDSILLMCADSPEGMPYQEGTSISISLSGTDSDELTGYFNKLAEGGRVNEPLTKAPWGDTFGMVTDQFGTNWMVNIVAGS